MSKYTITPEEIAANNVASAPTVLEGNPENNKAVFDKLPKLIAERHNILAEGFITHEERVDNPHSVTADLIGALTQDGIRPGENVVVVKNDDGSVTITASGGSSGGGDMYRSVYDTNADGSVDRADFAQEASYANNAGTAFSTQLASFATEAGVASNGTHTYIHEYSNNVHTLTTLTTVGSNGQFKSVTSAAPSSFIISDKTYEVVNGSDNEISLLVGKWYSFILDHATNTINFNVTEKVEIPKDVYSTEETLTNKVWIDGKPVYRKIVVGAVLTSTAVTKYDLSGSNIDSVVSLDLMLSNAELQRTPNLSGLITFFYVNADKEIELNALSTPLSGYTPTFIVEYTKI